jgi:hypothetical protein
MSGVTADGIEFADYREPTLTTIRQPRKDLGAAGARALLASIGGVARAQENPIVPQVDLLVRESTAPAAGIRKRASKTASHRRRPTLEYWFVQCRVFTAPPGHERDSLWPDSGSKKCACAVSNESFTVSPS